MWVAPAEDPAAKAALESRPYEPTETTDDTTADKSSRSGEDEPPGEGAGRCTETLSNAAKTAKDALVRDPSIAESVLSPAQIQAAADAGPWLSRIMGGTAIERLVARDLQSTFLHVGGAYMPDFIGSDGLAYELTSSNDSTIASHLRRPYVNADRLATYEPLPQDFDLGGSC